MICSRKQFYTKMLFSNTVVLGRWHFLHRRFAAESGGSGLHRRYSGHSVAHGVSGCPISRWRTDQVLFQDTTIQDTTKGIMKETATGVKKPDTYGRVAKAGDRPLSG